VPGSNGKGEAASSWLSSDLIPRCRPPHLDRNSEASIKPQLSIGAKVTLLAQCAGTEEEEVEMDETLDGDDTFIEEQEEEDADVTDVIGGNIEN